MRMIAEFSKEQTASYISHLDLQRVVQRSLRRANIPVAYSQGFNPHGLLSFATAVPVGCASICEIMDVTLEQEITPLAFISQLNLALPSGLHVFRAKYVEDSQPAPMSMVECAVYQANAMGDHAEAVEAFLKKDSCMAMKMSKKGQRQVDIRPMVYAMTTKMQGNDTVFGLRLRHDSAMALKPTLLFATLGIEDVHILRTALEVRKGDGWEPLYDILKEGTPF